MKRVYIDTNIFRFLKKNENPIYINLAELLLKYSDRYIYYYSSAHIQDLHRDKSDKKKEDLKYMNKYVKNNYLTFNKEKRVISFLTTPEEAYKPFSSFNWDDLNQMADLNKLNLSQSVSKDKEIEEKINELESFLKKTHILNTAKKYEGQPPNTKEIIEILFSDIKNEYSTRDLISSFTKLISKLYDDSTKAYRKIRLHSIHALKLKDKFNIDIDAFDFNQKMKDTPLQKSFIEFVNNVFSSQSHLQYPKLSYFIIAYSLLNILGIDNEKNRKVTFASTTNDAQHAFYAAHCDFLISDDKGLIQKAKVLYKLLGISTKVITTQEFLNNIDSLAGPLWKNAKDYLDFFLYDINNSMLIDKSNDFINNSQFSYFKSTSYHFNYFNYFTQVINITSPSYYIFYKKSNNYSEFQSFVEYRTLIDKMTKLFGADINKKGDFLEQEEIEILNKIWKGRIWVVGSLTLKLEVNYDIKQLIFVIVISK